MVTQLQSHRHKKYQVLVLNGPNLNLLGERDARLYGKETLAEVEKQLQEVAESLGDVDVHCRQSNHEGVLIDDIQAARHNTDGLIINAGAYTHTSIALHDTLLDYKKPIIEVHVSQVFKREAFRQHSYISPVAVGVIAGFGVNSYLLALQALYPLLKAHAN
ncbi:MAG: type II 3-dehydroquinate dehydratase [Candidatus Melainabacteria bacterium]|nr:type II 3-dehydroquinate dehydratase [Candidatus Melainabacteria bacterium]